jgi:Ni/Fe-hydrogenase subunit HybB-like protein
MTTLELPRPCEQRLLTPGTMVLLTLVGIGLLAAAYRFVFGLAAATNLDQQHPWGLWIAVDVATGVALAAGGFTTAALVHVFHRESFHAVVRPALLTAMLGYTFVGIGLMADLGRYYNIWHPAWPTMWQGNSVLFEVGICVMCYLAVLYIEFLPIVCERFEYDPRRPRLAKLCRGLHARLDRTMFVFILAGVVLSCLHQSSLGTLMVIAPSKMHPLWYTPALPLLFLLSAIAVGFPMVIAESLYASWSLGTRPETELLRRLAKPASVLLGVYLAVRLGDLVLRDAHRYLLDASLPTLLFLAEIAIGAIIPLIILARCDEAAPRWQLFGAALMVIGGVALNRVDVFLVAYRPPYATVGYFPSVMEFAVTAGLIALLIFCYRVLVTYLPVISQPVGARR